MKGDYSIQVDEWDDFQRDRELAEALEWKKNNDKIKMEDLSDMSKRTVRVQLSREYQVAEVTVSEIETQAEYEQERVNVVNQAKGILDSIFDGAPIKPTPKEYVQAVQNSTKPADGVYTLAHITTKFLKGKQFTYALKALNDGKLDLDKLNNAQSWQESNDLVFPKKY